jgi:hypothetical protein
MRHRRTKIWIDRFQTYLSVRIALYFLLYQIAVWLLIAFVRHVVGVVEPLLGWPIALSCLVLFASSVVFLGFLAIYDALCFCHRLVGPLFRFRQVIKAITDGKEVELVRLRKDDFLHELKEEFNEMLKVLQQRGAVELKPANPAQQQQEQPLSV